MTSTRTARVARQIQQELSLILEEQLKDPRVGMVTLTSVQMTPDLRLARVYFSRLGEADERLEAKAALEHAAGFLRRELGHRLRLRYLPELRFFIDDSLERYDRISDLLHAPRHSGAESDDDS
jgi:ribosome-binding factor A